MEIFLTHRSPIFERALPFDRFPGFARSSVKSTVSVQMGVEHWWNDTERGEPKYWERY
jgi:hypothetical protein